MSVRISAALIAVCLVATLAAAATFDRARQLYLSGDLEGARTELQELLDEGGEPEGRAAALRLLGQIEVDLGNWAAALEAWGALTDSHALSPEATAVSPTIRLLQALVECGCADGEPEVMTAAAEPAGPPAAAPDTVPEPAAAPAPSEPTPTSSAPAAPAAAPLPAPATAPAPPEVAPAPGLLVVGAWGAEYDASQEVVRDVVEFLDANGVGVRAGSTEVPAIRGADAVLSYLIDEAREAGAAGVLMLTTRFNFREYILVERYDLDGNRVWREKTTGGTALKERRDRGKPSWGLVERAKKRLAERIGTSDLPTG